MCLLHTRTVSRSLLRKIHLVLLKTGCNLADYARISNIVFDTTTTRGYPERFMLLKKAKEGATKSVRNVQDRKRLTVAHDEFLHPDKAYPLQICEAIIGTASVIRQQIDIAFVRLIPAVSAIFSN